MAPEPNDTLENSSNINDDIIVDNNDVVNFVVVHEDDVSGQSSDDNDVVDTEYAGYKLLQQDEQLNYASDEDNVGDDDDDGVGDCDCETTDGHLQAGSINLDAQNLNINYQHLTCNGISDELPATGLGFPDITPDYENQEEESVRDDNIDMNEDKVELVKNAMSGFSLPLTSIPNWAKNLSEDKWKESIVSSVNKQKPK